MATEIKLTEWEKLAAKYPQAFDEFFKWLYEEESHGDYKKDGGYVPAVFNDLRKFNIRDLYDFFDTQKLMVTIHFDKHPFVLNFYSIIDSGDDKNEQLFFSANDAEVPTWTERKDAEQYTFLVAFRLLEKILTEKI